MRSALHLAYIFPLLFFFHSFYEPYPLYQPPLFLSPFLCLEDVIDSPASHRSSDLCMLQPVNPPLLTQAHGS